MALVGAGAVAIWHDIAPEGREEFYAWHGSEHMPERVAIPGFLRGRRYVAVEGVPEFFNLYETASTAVLTGADYLARLNAPTPWTAATVRHFRGVARSLCEVAATFGEGAGGLCATLRYDVGAAAAAAHRAAMTAALRGLASAPGIAGAHLLVADEKASGIETAERRARGGPGNLVPRWIAIVEGWGDEAPFRAACRAFAASGAFAGASLAPDLAVYRLQNLR
ncbi:MAG: hypothetical protein OEX23_00815 [Betaproteobacteria bacterium]|nr:hypothetical protein [Betaproteobacteria bacterium]